MKDQTSLIAFYLPQYHEIKENSMWWGDGFTDWVSVQNAKPCFEGHIQPKIPYKSRYYNLLEKKVMERQVRMSQMAGISGFCFYHYWFDGKKLLEKPVENYLKWKDLKQNYCLSWANESWIRTWSNIDGNDWNPIGDFKCANKERSILIEQKYGGNTQWKEHFEYLLPFFRDDRYIQINGKPIFIIYRPDLIPCFRQMIRCWRLLAKKNGFRGLYIIVTNPEYDYKKDADGILLYEPGHTFHKELHSKIQRDKKKPQIYSYDMIWQKILNRKKKLNLPVFLGAFVGYDDSPRRGKDGIIVTGSTPRLFAYYLMRLLKKCKREKYERYIFITAWNEWGEGAYLEPDEKNKFKYLGACKWALEHKCFLRKPFMNILKESEQRILEG